MIHAAAIRLNGNKLEPNSSTRFNTIRLSVQPNQLKFHAKSVTEVRGFVQTRLSSLARAVGLTCYESYLFKDDHWTGMRFTLGVMRAEWMIGSDLVQIYNDVQLVERAQLTPNQEREQRRAA